MSNKSGNVGSCCIAEKRTLETIADGAPKTPFMKFGDRVRIEMFGADGHSIFGAIDQHVVQHKGEFALYGYFRSSAAFRARIALNLKGIKPELRFVHLLRGGGEQHNADYKAINPQALIPALAHDGHLITQSMAIIEYLNEIVPEPPILPRDSYGRARVREIAYVVGCDIHPVNNLRIGQYMKESSTARATTIPRAGIATGSRSASTLWRSCWRHQNSPVRIAMATRRPWRTSF